MTEAEIFELHLDTEGLIVTFAALDFSVFEGD